jgi:HAD superfamily hydrolase (TIGR01509 family)
MKLRALVWDVDGTLAETERDGHRVAFNRAFAEAGLPWQWDEQHYGELLAVAGGRERLLHDLQLRGHLPDDPAARAALAGQLHQCKGRHYERILAAERVPLRPGVAELIEECAQRGVQLAIATTTGQANVDALLRPHWGAQWARRFACVMCAEQAPRKKPDPQVYLRALDALGAPPGAVLAIEDSPAGAAAARAAGFGVVVVRSHYFMNSDIGAAIAAGPSLGSGQGWSPAAARPAECIGLEQLERWLAPARQAHAGTHSARPSR